MKSFAIALLVGATGLAGCTSHDVGAVRASSPAASSANGMPTATVTTPAVAVASSHATPSMNPDVKPPEEVVALRNIGSVSWTCKGSADDPVPTFSTTFKAMGATETVSYSFAGHPTVSKTLQGGQHLTTPFTHAARHLWTVEQPIDPYNTTVRITVVMRPDHVFGCFNPVVTVSRVRVSNAVP
jgi:hypothetical protein